METKILAIFTRTPLHVGAGNSVGAVDCPIMRERHTRIPIIPGSSLKGVLADLWNDDCEKDKKGNITRKKGSDAEKLFGSQIDDDAKAGNLLVGEARVLLFPVRSAKGLFTWVTSPLAITRLNRDLSINVPVPNLYDMDCHGGSNVTFIKENNENEVILEEYCLKSKQSPEEKLVQALEKLLPEEMKSHSKGRITIVSDEMFSYFCENTCEVVTRIRVNDETGTVDSGALFNQEQVPSETLFYSVIGEKESGCIEKLKAKLSGNDVKNIIQIGGDETIGLGYCSVKIVED